MKSMLRSFTILTLLSLMSSYGLADPAPEVPEATQSDLGSTQCTEMGEAITVYCPQNQSLNNVNDNSEAMAFVASGDQSDGARNNARMLNQQTLQSQQALQQANAECQATLERCNSACGEMEQQGRAKYQEGRRMAQNPTTATAGLELANRGSEEVQFARNTRNQCEQVASAQQAANNANLAEIGQLLQGLAQVLAALGMGGGAEEPVDLTAANEDEEGDVCEGPDKDLYLECLGQSDPLATTAGVGGTGVPELGGGAGNLLQGAAEQGQPGGELGNNTNNAGRPAGLGSGIGAAGFGSGGGLPTGSGGSSSAARDKIDTDIYKGYMGGGSGGIGSYGGGGGGGGGSRLSASGLRGPASAGNGKNRLQSQLDKIAGKAGRRPASLGGTNGPMQNIWGVVNKTYKKTSPSMYHKE